MYNEKKLWQEEIEAIKQRLNEIEAQLAKEYSPLRATTVENKKYIEQDLAARQRDTRNLPITDNYVTPPAYKKRNGKREL